MSGAEKFVEARIVRPYTLTGGRTYNGEIKLPLEALVQGVSGVRRPPMALELGRALALCTTNVLSVAELSAHLALPLGVTRVLIGDLVAAGLVRVHHTEQTAAPAQAQFRLLESVLNGISQI